MTPARTRLALLAAGAAATLFAASAWQQRSRSTTNATAAASVPEIARRAGPGTPVIVVGLDGADWQLLDRYMARGTMPQLARLVAEGAGGALETIHPPLSPLVWTSMVTGVSPLEHRILDFTRFSPLTRRKEPITSDERRAPALWNMAGYAGRSCAVFGLWATYPAEAVNGIVVSDRLSGFLYAEEDPPPGIVYPPEREAWARETLRAAEREVGLEALRAYLPWLTPDEYQRFEEARRGDPYAHPVTALRRILVETQLYHGLAREWIERERPDLAIVYFQGTDSIGHAFAPFAPPRQPSVSQSDYERYSAVPERYFQHVDGLLGEYHEIARRRGATLMLVSDHGFFWDEGRPRELSSVAHATAGKWHRKDGIYLVWGPGIQPASGHHQRAGVTQLCASVLAALGLPRGLGLAEPVLPGLALPSGKAINYALHYRPPPPPEVTGAQSDQEAIEKLKALGYIGANEAATAPAGARGTRTAGSWNNEGLVLRAEGRSDAAVEAFERALELDPGLGASLWNLSDVLSQLGRDKERSDALLVKAFATGMPEAGRFLVERAIEYHKSGEAARSVQLLDAALAARQDEPEAWLFRGRYRVEAGDCRGALADFRRALALAPAHAGAYASEGIAYLCLGDRSAARRSLARSLQIDPDQPRVKEFLAKL